MPASINSTAEDYVEQLKKLTPEGLAWPVEDDSNWIKLITAIAQEMARVDAMCATLVDESFPDTTTQLLPNWERVAGLPDECTELGETYEVRRKNLIAKLVARGGATPQYFIDVAAALGYEITITEFDPFRVNINAVGDALNGVNWQFVWQVNSALNTIIWFRAGLSAAGEALAVWGNDRLECVINRLKPAHTTVIFSYT